jgi:GR25 family glycosyltransferase involved in LPS biosynthesis
MSKMKIYLINLESRADRLANVISRVREIDSPIIRVSAITGEEVRNMGNPIFAPQNNVANWHSHMKVLRLFLDSKDEYCVILEDDVLFVNNGVNFLTKLIDSKVRDIDILQFGYLSINGRLDSGEKDALFRFKARCARKLKSLALSVLDRFQNLDSLKSRLNRTKRILKVFEYNEKVLGLNSPLVEGFEAGTHCYLISRNGAKALLKYNNPALMSADLSMIVLSVARNFMVVRTTISYAVQDDTPVSIGEHSSLKFDLGSIIISTE